jgi:hypothetical protein
MIFANATYHIILFFLDFRSGEVSLLINLNARLIK